MAVPRAAIGVRTAAHADRAPADAIVIDDPATPAANARPANRPAGERPRRLQPVLVPAPAATCRSRCGATARRPSTPGTLEACSVNDRKRGKLTLRVHTDVRLPD